MKKNLLFLTFFIPLFVSFAQIPIGEFREHLSYHYFLKVTASNDNIYAATKNSLMIINKKDESLSTLSKVERLSEIGIEQIKYIKDHDLLVVAYQNANLDFIKIKGDTLYNLSDIKMKSIVGSKKINHLYVLEDTLYLSCAFGVILVDLGKKLIRDTWFTVINDEYVSVNGLEIFENKYYITTSHGVFKINTNNNKIANFSVWERETELAEEPYSLIKIFNNTLFVKKDKLDENGADSIFMLKDGSWHYVNKITPQDIRAIDVYEDEILVLGKNTAYIYNKDFEEILAHQLTLYYGHIEGYDAIFDGKNQIWVAKYDGVRHYLRSENEEKQFWRPSPDSDLVGAMAFHNGTLATVPGSREGFGFAYEQAAVSFFQQEKWSSFGSTFFETCFSPRDFNNIVIHPKRNHEFYIASWHGGLFKTEYGLPVRQWKANDNSSPLESFLEYVQIAGLCFDKNDNLWLINCRSTKPLKVLKNDGTWQSFPLNLFTNIESTLPEHILIDSRGYKWITCPRVNELVAFSENGTIDNLSDDMYRRINVNVAATKVTNYIHCIAEDKDGKIWIGTDQGIKVIHDPENVFKQQVFAKNILLEQNGYTQNLLEFETVLCMAVDGANLKWFGTSKAGVFLISADGTEELLHFTEDNSPLFSNQVTSIAIDGESGEVYFGTTKGIISYRGTATEGKENYDDLLVFPNPVREGYNGPIAVKGLMENSFCKIVDAAGMLIWQGYANGGQLIWNGKDFYGNRPATGVYFVMSSSKTGKEKAVAKILFIK